MKRRRNTQANCENKVENSRKEGKEYGNSSQTLKECSSIIENPGVLRRRNPFLTRIRYLPKVHKSDNKMREIMAVTNSLTQKITRWLLRKFAESGLSMGNGAEL